MHEFSKPFPKLWCIAKFIRAHLVDAYCEREYRLNGLKPILVSDGCILHKEILQYMQQHPCEDVDIVPMVEVHSNTTSIAPDSKRSSKEKIGDTRRIEDIIM